jgi:hypothetical protein
LLEKGAAQLGEGAAARYVEIEDCLEDSIQFLALETDRIGVDHTRSHAS